jgi:hypothetical protein
MLCVLSLAPLAGNLPHDAALKIPKEVWTTLPQLAQEMARAAGQIRARFTQSAVLQDLNKCLDVKAATTNDVNVIRETDGTIGVGSVHLPVLTGLSEHPKGEEKQCARRLLCHGPFYANGSGSCNAGFKKENLAQFMLHKARVQLASEFVTTMKSDDPDRTRGSGVLLSGPNGVGKSAVGLLAYQACLAQRLPVVYIPFASVWVREVRAGKGDEYFLTELLKQNADLIAANDILRPVFLPYWCREEKLCRDTLDRLTAALSANPSIAFGAIMDEVQVITQAVAAGPKAVAVSAEQEETGSYFRYGWYNWTVSPAQYFVRLDIASSHGKVDCLNGRSFRCVHLLHHP